MEEPQDEAGYANPADTGSYGDGDAQEVPDKSDEEKFVQTSMACMCALIVASCAELAQAARICDLLNSCSGTYMFAVLVGALSVACNVGFGAGVYFRPEMFKGWIAYFALVMVALWGVAVAVLTFDKPFQTTGNGYFATWGGAIISVYWAQISFSKLHALLGSAFTNAVSGTLERRVAMLVMIFSYVCAYAVLTFENGPVDPLYFSQEKWGFACAITCGALITLWMLLKSFTGIINGYPSSLKYLSYILTLMWLFGVGVMTFDFPFIATGNGYFTAWGSFLGSIYLAYLTTANPSPTTTNAE